MSTAAVATLADTKPRVAPRYHSRRVKPQPLDYSVNESKASGVDPAASEGAAGAKAAARRWRLRSLKAAEALSGSQKGDSLAAGMLGDRESVAADGGQPPFRVAIGALYASKSDTSAEAVDSDRRGSRGMSSDAGSNEPTLRRLSILIADGGAGTSPGSKFRHRASVHHEGSMNARFRRKSKRPDLLRKFKASAWISIIIKRLCAAHLRNSEDNDSPYMRDVKFVEKLKDDSDKPKLLFDVGLFKANKEIRISEDCKKILGLPRWARTEGELLHVQISLRTIADYAAYPVATQRQIAEVGQYLKYESRRIIVREGHPPWYFYFIISGAVAVLVLDEDRKYVIPKAILRRGQSFGELALLSGSRRQSTVVATEDVEMVGIWHEDYKRIFDNGGGKKSEDEFLRSLQFLNGWPLEVADEHPQQFRYHFYKQGEVIVKDSCNSMWIIVVKSGSLNVIKKLKHVDPFEFSPKKPYKINVPARKWQRKLKPILASKEHWSLSRQAREEDGTAPAPAVDEPRDTYGTADGDAIRRPPSADEGELQRPASPSEEAVIKKAQLEMSNMQQSDASAVVKQDVRTAAQELDKGYSGSDQKGVADDVARPIFVHVRTLTNGSVFGLNEVLFGTQPSFSLVSNGAECVLIEKNLYAKYLTEQLQKTQRFENQVYPGDEEMQNNLQISVDWAAYKSIVISKALEMGRRSNRFKGLEPMHRP